MTACDWFDVRSVAPGISFITQEMVAPFLPCNISHVPTQSHRDYSGRAIDDGPFVDDRADWNMRAYAKTIGRVLAFTGDEVLPSHGWLSKQAYI